MKTITKTPVVILNFKTYLESTGKNALNLAKISEKVAKETGFNIAVSVQAPDVYRIAQEVEIPVLAQHIDPVEAGGHTGSNLAECLEEAGA